MLVLSIRKGGGFCIGREDGTGPQIEVAVFKIERNQIKIGILADGPDGEKLAVRRGLKRIEPIEDASSFAPKPKPSCLKSPVAG